MNMDVFKNKKARRAFKVISISLLSLTLICSSIAGLYFYKLYSKAKTIEKVPSIETIVNRPKPVTTEDENILLLGVDGSFKKKYSVEQSNWPVGKFRSDTIMFLNIPKDRKSINLISIPRDSFANIYDEKGIPHGKQKINAAFSEYGPLGTVSTVEHFLDVRVDHLIMVDWNGFKDITTALGGVKVHVAKTVTDTNNHITWTEGDHVVKGEEALMYVRTRYGLERGDFDRIKRQQNFLRAVGMGIKDQNLLANPIKFSNLFGAIIDSLTVSNEFTLSDMKNLALSIKDIPEDQMKFLTLPAAQLTNISPYGSVVIINDSDRKILSEALRAGNFSEFIKNNPSWVLGSVNDIS